MARILALTSRGTVTNRLDLITILGLTYTRTYFNIVSTNWKDILQRLETAVAVWKKRDLSIYVRAKVLQRFSLSKVYYAARVFTMPQRLIKMFENAIWSFVEQESRPLVKRRVCIASRDFGGLDVPHLLLG